MKNTAYLLICITLWSCIKKELPKQFVDYSMEDSRIDSLLQTMVFPRDTLSDQQTMGKKIKIDNYCDTAFHFPDPTSPIYHIFRRPISFNLAGIELSNSIDRGKKQRSIFLSPVHIESCRFIIQPQLLSIFVTDLFTFTRFDEAVDMSGNYYTNSISFYNCRFRKGINFVNLSDTINLPVNFQDCKLSGVSRFNQYFNGEKFSSIFAKDLMFTGDTITGKLDFARIRLFGTAQLRFIRSTLPDSMDLSELQTNTEVDLTQFYPNVMGRKCQINLLNTDFDRIKLQYENFHLYFPDSILKDPRYTDVVNGTYQSLLGNFKKRGFDNSYELLDIEYKDWQSHANIWTWLSGWWWRYGYEKGRVLIWTFVFLAILALINCLFIYDHLISAYKIAGLERSNFAISRNPVCRALQYFGLSAVYTGCIFFKLSFDFDRVDFKKMNYVVIIVLQYAIGLLCTGYLVNWIISK